VLRPAAPWPLWLRWLGALFQVAGLVAWLKAPHRPRD
jgi:hypothetical protein